MRRPLILVLLTSLFLTACASTSSVASTLPATLTQTPMPTENRPTRTAADAQGMVSATQPLVDCYFYNQMEIDDPPGDAMPSGAPSYVDVIKLTIRQYGQYVQFVWEANGNPFNNDDQFYFLVFDTDRNPDTGQRWDGAVGELKIRIYHTADLVYFDEIGNVIKEQYNLPVVFEGNKFYLNVKKDQIPAGHFNFYFESSGGTIYHDYGTLREILLQPPQDEIKVVIEASEMVLPSHPPLINIPDKSKPIQLYTYLVQDGTGMLLPSSEVEYSVYHPVPRITNPSSIISVDPSGLASYIQEGYVFATARSRTCSFISERTILATGEVYGSPESDNVVAVFPPDYVPSGSQYSFGYMMTGYQNYTRTVNLAYDISSDLYNGFKPFNQDKQIFALLVLEGHCGGNNNPLETAPCCYMNCGNGTPHYNVVIHEMGHNFATTKGMIRLTEANSRKIGNAGFGECVASLPVIYIAWEFYNHPEQYGMNRSSFEWNYYREFLNQDIPYAESQLRNFEALVRSGQTAGIFDNNGLFDGVAVFCSFFQSYSYGFTPDPNPYGNEVITGFLHIFDDRELPAFSEDQVETYFSAAFSVAVGNDVRDKLRFWGFSINDVYYDQIYSLLTNTATETPTPTPTNTSTKTPTSTNTLTNTPIPTNTPTKTPTPTNTPTRTPFPTSTATQMTTSTPTVTSTPTITPKPTDTPGNDLFHRIYLPVVLRLSSAPVLLNLQADPANDWISPMPRSASMDIRQTSVWLIDANHLRFEMKLAGAIPVVPSGGRFYGWFLDTDLNLDTGQRYHDIGSDFNVQVSYVTNRGWVGQIFDIGNGSGRELSSIAVSGDTVTFTIPLSAIRSPRTFYWISIDQDDVPYYADIVPNTGHIRTELSTR